MNEIEGTPIDNGMVAVNIALAQRAELDRLHDALRGLLDYVEEGCPDGGRYAIIEARAALKGFSVARS